MSRGSWYRWNKKDTVNDFHQFRIVRLIQEKVVKHGVRHGGSWHWLCNGKTVSTIGYEVNTLGSDSWIRVHYRNTRTSKDYDYKIRLVTTTPHYGGVRWWFICPAQNCGRRVGVLYMASILACRHCYNIAYASQNQPAYDTMCDKAFKIASQIGHDGNVIDGFYGKKPKGMHWKTYNRKVAEMNNLAERGMAGAMARFGRVF